MRVAPAATDLGRTYRTGLDRWRNFERQAGADHRWHEILREDGAERRHDHQSHPGSPGFRTVPHIVTPAYDGAPDLDIAPLSHGAVVALHPAVGGGAAELVGELALGAAGRGSARALTTEIVGSGDAVLATRDGSHGRPRAGPRRASAQASGWHGVKLSGRFTDQHRSCRP